MREKLIEVLSENFAEFCNVDIIAGHCKIRAITFDADKFADHLIASGVTIPVRCKDCRFYRKPFCIIHDNKHGWLNHELPEHFCSHGERKSND